MNRTRRMKLTYLGVLVLVVMVSLYLSDVLYISTFTLVLVVLTIFVLGRIAAYAWKDLILGRRLADRGDFIGAQECFTKFLFKLNKNKLLNSLIWILPSFYTTSAEAMTINNIGVCNLEIGEFEAAELSFNDALERDSEYPLPYYNLAGLDRLSGQIESSIRNLLKSVELGYSGGTVDSVIHKAKSLYAKQKGVLSRRGSVLTFQHLCYS